MPFDRELFAALKSGLADLSKSECKILRLIWEHPNVPVYHLRTKIGGKAGGAVWLAVGNSIAKRKLWDRMPARIKRKNQWPGYLPFYSGVLVRLHTVIDQQQRPFAVFELHDEAVKALQVLKVITSRRQPPSVAYRRIEQIEDDTVPFGFNAPAETKRVRRSIIERRGQPRFRNELLSVYKGRCAVTGCSERNVLEAAHIVGFRSKGRYVASNGILLRADWHTLFDLGLWAINPARLTVELSPRVTGKDYVRFRGHQVSLPQDPKSAPTPEILAARFKRFRKAVR